MASFGSRLCRKYGPKAEEVAAAERREALPCASVSRRSGKYAAACYSAPFGVPLPPFSSEGHPEPPTHVKTFAGSDDAWPEQREPALGSQNEHQINLLAPPKREPAP